MKDLLFNEHVIGKERGWRCLFVLRLEDGSALRDKPSAG